MPPPHRDTNRLVDEASPYLLQHAHNPVDWRPWGDEAFAEARRRRVPIFLSIGYSACYWCHVMERESFEDESIASTMNRLFVCVKVDREQRPDVDDLYMTATQIMTGHGGWPMSVFLEPDTLKPFWCGTYFPPEPRPGMGSMPTFPQVMDGVSAAWTDQRAQVMQQAEALAQAVREHLAPPQAPVPLGVQTVQAAAGALLRMFDRTNGGFGAAPKFPQPAYLDLLLDVRERAGDDATKAALDQAVRHTLDRMAVGGVRDQVGGGFHRYSVDATWTVPHFEKMLYDNAMLAEIYARAGVLYNSPFYRQVASSTITYVLREMTLRDAAGTPLAFYTAQDAEVDHREGLNYLWTPDQVRAALDPADAELAIRLFSLDRGPNFRDPHHPDEPASNILRMDLPPDDMADRLGLDRSTLTARLVPMNATLYAARQRRNQPHLDDKAVLSWNALMIRALAETALIEPSAANDLRTALSVSRSLLASMTAPDGTLLRVMRAGRAQTPAMLEDYAAMIRALVTLARAAGTPNASDAHASQNVPAPPASMADSLWALEQARRLITQAESLFGDATGGFFDTRQDATDLFVRSRATYDGAMPAASTLMALALAELAIWTRDPADIDRAIAALVSISAAIAENPVGSAVGTRALLTMLKDPALAAGRLGYDTTGSIAAPPTPTESSVATGTTTAGTTTSRAAGTAHASPPTALDFTPVEVFAPDEPLTVRPEHPVELRLMIRIAPGFHVVAADPGPDAAALGLVPFRIGIVDAQPRAANAPPALAAYADYPAGTPFQPSASVAAMNVYEGEFELSVVLERGAGPLGTPLLVVTFQACNATECLKPQRLELDVSIDG